MPSPPRIALARLPTPLLRLARLSHECGAEIWIKRDDLTGLELSGNKVRKLEFVIADARARGCDCIITEGTPQSNHCRATAAACARLGLEARLLLRPAPPAGPPQGNLLLDHAFGARCYTFARPDFDQRRAELVTAALNQARADGRTPHYTPMGASEPAGCWGYIEALRELLIQLDTADIAACDLLLPVSSGGTLAGAALGIERLDAADRIRLRGIAVSDDVDHHRDLFARLRRETIEAYGLDLPAEAAPPDLTDRFVGPGYAIPTPAAREAMRLLARSEAILLDPVYTAKAFGALLADVRAKTLGHTRPVVFWHTGGAFSNFAWPELLLETAP